MTLTTEQRTALVDALENGGEFKCSLHEQALLSAQLPGLICYQDIKSGLRMCLSDAGRIVAELCQRLEYAERPRSCFCECGAACTVKHGKRKD